MRFLRKVPVVIALVVVVLGATAAATWAVMRDDESETRGSCDSALYSLEVEPDDGGLEVTFELTSGTPGETWDVVVRRGAEVLFEGERTTDDEGEIDLDLHAASDDDATFTATATTDATTCTARLSHG